MLREGEKFVSRYWGEVSGLRFGMAILDVSAPDHLIIAALINLSPWEIVPGHKRPDSTPSFSRIDRRSSLGVECHSILRKDCA